MESSPDEVLRARAKIDENAAEILRLAVERGLITEESAEVAAEKVREITQGFDRATPPPVMEVLQQTGAFDEDTLVSLARELGADPGERTVPRGADPFDMPPVSDWDRYELIEFIGRGGMGDVYKAKDPRLGRYVALKFLRRDTPEIVRRFTREAQIQARIDHDNVCQVFEVGEVEGHPYIAMQYIAGGSLKQISDLLSIQEKVTIIVDVADALHAAHQAGLIHRDVKPANILVERDADGRWRPYVVDFGIARDVDSRDLTVSGMVLGTPAFAAPEQVRGETRKLDRRTDIYSLGATLYWFLTDLPPYEGGYPEVLAGITDREPVPPHRLAPEVPVDLETITLKCLEKDPDRRYESARQVSEDLRRFLAGEAITARPATLIYKLSKKIRKHRGLAATAVGVLLAFAVVTSLSFRSNLQARRQAAIAQRLVERVKEIEGLVRVGSMMPLHDRRHGDQMLRERMLEIENEMAAVGRIGLGPGHYALGRGYLALQDVDTALEHLDLALEHDYRAPGVSYALGLAMGKLYERHLHQARQLDNEALRAAYRSDIEDRYREPALRHLRRAGSQPLDATAYVEGLIAFYEGRYDHALTKAAEAYRQVEWLYETKKLEGDIYVELGTDRRFRGDYGEAIEALGLAGAAYHAAAEVARSDPTVYDGDCERWFQVMETKLRLGEAARPAFENAVSSCRSSVAVDPDRPDAFERLTRLHWRWADALHDGGEDPTHELEQAVAAAERAIELDPASAAAHYGMGGALTVAAVFELAQGHDPRDTLARAVASLEDAIRHEPGMVHAHDDLGYAHERVARYEMSIGEDPRPSLASAIASFRRAIELNPSYANAYNNSGIALWRTAYYELETGLDPTASLDEALDAFAEAIRLNPNYAYAYANRGLAYRTRAKYELEGGSDPMPWIEAGHASFDRALEINPSIFWAYPERAATELLAARWVTGQGVSPGPYYDRAAAAAERAVEINPQNATAYQTAARVHRWRVEWLLADGRDASEDIARGRRLAARALELNPSLAKAMVTDAALLVLEAEADPGRREALVREASAMLDRAQKLNPLVARDADRIRAAIQ